MHRLHFQSGRSEKWAVCLSNCECQNTSLLCAALLQSLRLSEYENFRHTEVATPLVVASARFNTFDAVRLHRSSLHWGPAVRASSTAATPSPRRRDRARPLAGVLCGGRRKRRSRRPRPLPCSLLLPLPRFEAGEGAGAAQRRRLGVGFASSVSGPPSPSPSLTRWVPSLSRFKARERALLLWGEQGSASSFIPRHPPPACGSGGRGRGRGLSVPWPGSRRPGAGAEGGRGRRSGR